MHTRMLSRCHVFAIFRFWRAVFMMSHTLTTHNSLVKAIAFTLAETLVVMGIIGVVAALTIPNLNQSTGDREKIAKVKKIYSDYSKVKFYEYGKEEIKNDILREAYTFYVSAKKLHENVEDIKNYINLIRSFDHMEAEAKEKDLLDKIQEI